MGSLASWHFIDARADGTADDPAVLGPEVRVGAGPGVMQRSYTRLLQTGAATLELPPEFSTHASDDDSTNVARVATSAPIVFSDTGVVVWLWGDDLIVSQCVIGGAIRWIAQYDPPPDSDWGAAVDHHLPSVAAVVGGDRPGDRGACAPGLRSGHFLIESRVRQLDGRMELLDREVQRLSALVAGTNGKG